ncbi:MAG: hypothetical protein ACXVXD_16090, partial [Nocardioidaceae bacterium]
RTMLRLAGGAAEHTVVLVQGWAFDHDAMRRNLDHLVVRLGQDAAWVDEQTAHVDVWIDRVLTQHQEVFS